jgi:hypothetical protein
LPGKHLTETDASGKAAALHLCLGNIKEAADHFRRVAFHVTEQEKQALVGGQVAQCIFQFGAANITVAEAEPPSQDRRGFFLAQRKSLAQLVEECGIDGERIWPFLLLESAHESNSKNFFRFDLITRHIKSEGKSTMTVTFVNIPLLLLAGLFGSLGDNKIRFRGELTFEIEQGYPNSA